MSDEEQILSPDDYRRAVAVALDALAKAMPDDGPVQKAVRALDRRWNELNPTGVASPNPEAVAILDEARVLLLRFKGKIGKT
jgi:hypothetical protein